MSRGSVVIIGAGQAGLAVSYELTRHSFEHEILERSSVGHTWRTRWESFCLVTPNWAIDLPGAAYEGPDPNGFLPRDEIVAYLERYADNFDAPIRMGVDVSSVEPAVDGRFLLRTSEGDLVADAVVVASGGYQKPHRPVPAASLPSDVYAIDSERYRRPDDLPPGSVLIVGSGQTGVQIAEELQLAGREVTVACGRAPWVPRRVEGRDIVTWLSRSPFLDQTVADLPNPVARLGANMQTSGKDGGHDLHYRTLAEAGVTLAGRLVGVEGHHALFAPDLDASVSFGDERYRYITTLVVDACRERGETPPAFPEPQPFTATGPDRMDLHDCGAVIFTSGYRPDYARWIHFPSAFDDMGFPIQIEGESSVVPGLFFIGTHFLRNRKSATLMGIAEDAVAVTDRIAAWSKG